MPLTSAAFGDYAAIDMAVVDKPAPRELNQPTVDLIHQLADTQADLAAARQRVAEVEAERDAACERDRLLCALYGDRVYPGLGYIDQRMAQVEQDLAKFRELAKSRPYLLPNAAKGGE